jgi:hypothetical protein
MQQRGADALAPALQHGIGAAAVAKLGVEPGVRWHLQDAVVDPRVNDAGTVLAGDLAALAVAETPTLDRVHGACSNMLANRYSPLEAMTKAYHSDLCGGPNDNHSLSENLRKVRRILEVALGLMAASTSDDASGVRADDRSICDRVRR